MFTGRSLPIASLLIACTLAACGSGGGAFVPSGATCNAPIGTLPPGYAVSWLNEATGESLSATARLHCLLLPKVAWETADIPLVMGSNPIVVSAQSADRRAGTTTPLAGSIVAGAPAQYTFFPALPLAPLTTYEVRIADVRDRNGLPMQSEFVSSFTTAP